MVKSSRGDMGIKVAEVTGLLAKAGWEARRGAGDHTVLTKPGEQQIVLAESVSMAQWKNVERAIGVQLETLLTKQKAGRGHRLNDEELRKRLGLAREMKRAGFPDVFVRRRAGLYLFEGVALKDLLAAPVEDVVTQYTRRERRTEEATHVPTPPPILAVPVLEVKPESLRSEVDAILELMQGLAVEMKELLEVKGERNRAFLAAYRHTSELKQRISDDLEALLNKMAHAWGGE